MTTRPSSLLTATFLALAPALASVSSAPAGDVIPTDGMVITRDTTLVPGRYELPSGVAIGASGVTLDLNGAVLVGRDFQGAGITCVEYDDVVIRNGVLRGYFYGVHVEACARVEVRDNDLSGNWVDPASQGPGAPFLDINAPPNLADRTNLGGGLFMLTVAEATVAGNTMRDGENGMDLYFVADSLVADNDASDNTGWGIHLHGSCDNMITGNVADRCTRPGLGDSAGMLLVMASHGNEIIGNQFRFGGDGFFIGNEHGCPSNDNLVEANDGSFAGANAFEATFSRGNRFLANIADGSNYGFWLGYSHSGNEIIGNQIRANNVSGIEIEHGQANVIAGNTISGNGGAGVVLRTDGLVHFPPAAFPCLDLPNQAASRDYSVRDNVITSNFGLGLQLVQTKTSTLVNNLLAGNAGGTAASSGAGNVWSLPPERGENIVGGPWLGGNYWDDYAGVDRTGDGLGDTEVPHTAGGAIEAPGDAHPLIGDPVIKGFDSPASLCQRHWIDLGRNTRADGAVFDTSNGTHFGTDGVTLYLLESANSDRFDSFDVATGRYQPLASLPEAVWDGGDLQFGGGTGFAGVGIQFVAADGSGKGPRLYSYDRGADVWSRRPDSTVNGDRVANEALAYDPVNEKLYATVVAVIDGGVATARQRLAVFDPAADAWIAPTAKSAVDFAAGSEIEYLDGKIYAWPGGFGGGSVTGADSTLLVYDIATDTWSTTPTLQASGIIPGLRTGAIDIWGVTLTTDVSRGRLFVIGGETNRQVYVYEPPVSRWTVAPLAVYDGGWGDGLEYVAATDRLYQIDGRNAVGTPQGTAVLAPPEGDLDGNGVVGFTDLLLVLAGWGPCGNPCCPADVDDDGNVGFSDLLAVLAAWG